jgi:hypothetical protein
VIEAYAAVANYDYQGKTEKLGEKPTPVSLHLTAKFTHGFNTALRGGKPASSLRNGKRLVLY